MGTPAYLSPEQVRGDIGEIDYRTDIYSLGVTLYELLTRQKPFRGETREQIIAGICTTEPAEPRRVDPHIPLDLETICLRAMEKEPERRHPSAILLAEDLRRFSEGRPILSRRTSRLEKVAKWVRRHKALTAAMLSAAAALLLAGGLTWNISAARQREAVELLNGSYEQLAFYDNRAPEIVMADVARAEELNPDPIKLHLVHALAVVNTDDPSRAIIHLRKVLEEDPSDIRAWYLLSWAYWVNQDRTNARTAFEEAEQAGSPKTADAWFFPWSGCSLSMIRRPPIECYRQAIALRREQHEFYPLAVLHLARARNQLLYATRSIDAFAEAEASLRQLIDQEHYGAYPYYLLSIAHRLAAEVYSGSEGIRDGSLVKQHYEEALHWARRGQTLEPKNDRPITAEAECLESMGQYAEAIEARRGRAIVVADSAVKRCEGYYYRWRLHYWTGNLEAALDDINTHNDCDPQSPFFAHFYPALVLAELGRMDEALAHARALAEDAPENAQAVLWSATCLRLLGRPEEARALLDERAEVIDFAVDLVTPQSEEWIRALYAYCQHGGPLTALEELAEETDLPWRLWGEAYFHASALWLAEGDRAAALEGFQRAYRSFDSEQRYTYHAKLIFNKMREVTSWPAWIGVLWSSGLDIRLQRMSADLIALGSDGEGEN